LTLLRVESYKQGIVLSTAFSILNKGLTFLNGILVAYFFGVGTGTDIYFYVSTSLLLLGAFFSSLNSTVIIPESMMIRANEGNTRSIAFLNFFFYLYALLTALCLIPLALQPVTVFSRLSNFSYADLLTYRALLYFSLPLFLLITIINLLTDILTSHKYFTIPMMIGIINGAATLIIVCFFNNHGIQTILFGLLASYTINLAILIFLMKRKLRWRFGIVRPVREKRIWKNIGFALSANVTSSLSSYTPMYVLSGFNAGIITALTLAQQISSLPNTLITYQFSSVAGIKFNETYAHKKFVELKRIFSETANFLHFIMTPLSCIIFFYSDEIVSILSSFIKIKADVADNMGTFIKYLGLLLPLYVSNTLFARLFMASQKVKEAFWFQFIANLVQVVLIYFAVRRFGVIGYPVALVSVYIVSTFFYYFLEKLYFNLMSYDKILKLFCVFIAINLAMSFLTFIIFKQLSPVNPWVALSIAVIAQYIVLIAATRAFRINEALSLQIDALLSQLRNKFIFNKSNIKNGL
jgi:putative peptidoglycan lipid II flippase